MRKRTHLFLWPAAGVVFLDQVTKWIVVQSLSRYESIPVIPGLFNLVHVRNRGMAFGLMNRPDMNLGFYFLTAATLAAIVLLVIWCRRLNEKDRGLILGLSLILGGAVGNLIDRVRLREVVDFLDFHVTSYHWPAFNAADSAITVGTIWVGAVLIFGRKSHG